MPGGAASGPKLRVSCETPAAMMARPSCRGHLTTQFSRRGAHSPPPIPCPPNSRTPHNAETEPLVCPTASNLRPTVARAARGRELRRGGCAAAAPLPHATSPPNRRRRHRSPARRAPPFNRLSPLSEKQTNKRRGSATRTEMPSALAVAGGSLSRHRALSRMTH